MKANDGNKKKKMRKRRMVVPTGIYERTKECREEMTNRMRQLWRDPEYRSLMSRVCKGRVGPWTGKKMPIEMRRKLSESHKGKLGYWTNKKRPSETGEKISKANKGKLPWNIGLTKETDKRVKKYSETRKGIKFTKTQIRKMLTRRIPSSLEEEFQNIIDKYNLPYKYVGDGSFILECYNPDFINTNGEKIAIEVYAKYYKKRNHIKIDDWKKERRKTFKKYGWKVLYFDETQVNEDYVLRTFYEEMKGALEDEIQEGD